MRIVRTFYPIGQGAFYGERFFVEGQCVYSIVYDCGVEVVGARQKSIVQQAFSKDDIINYLFISHLDEDHISLVMTLKQTVKRIEKIVLPYIDLDTISKLVVVSKAVHNVNVTSFLNYIRLALSGDAPLNDETELVLISPDEQEIERRNRGVSVFSSGQPFGYSLAKWLFIPYNKHIERKIELERQLTNLLRNPLFVTETCKIGLSIKTSEDLIGSLCSDSFAELVENIIIKKLLQKAYKSITGTINQNSLLLYSGPDLHSDGSYMICSMTPFSSFLSYPFRRFRHWRVACLYTGDGDLSMDEFKHDLNNYWKHIGTIQLPHHGSLRSFKFSKNVNAIDRSYCFPVSCGETNKYGHPSGKVISFLLSQGCLPVVVTENSSSCFEQVIVFDEDIDVKTGLNRL